MQEKFLKEAMNLVVGKQGEELTKLLDTKKYVNEFLIAKKLGITINQTRNLLYKLSDYGLVSSNRKKDKRKGWYTYFWKIEVLKSLEFLKEIFSKEIDKIKDYIKNREENRFYFCERCDVEYGEETAMLHNFTCDECGNVFVSKDNSKLVKDWKKELERLEKQRTFIEEEIAKERDKIEKKREKEFRKEEKEKKVKRKALAKKRLKERLKEQKKTGKKIEKKKIKQKKKAKHQEHKTKKSSGKHKKNKKR